MSKANEFFTVIFCVIAAVLLGHDSLRISLGLALFASAVGIWVNEICRAIRQSAPISIEPERET